MNRKLLLSVTLRWNVCIPRAFRICRILHLWVEVKPVLPLSQIVELLKMQIENDAFNPCANYRALKFYNGEEWSNRFPFVADTRSNPARSRPASCPSCVSWPSRTASGSCPSSLPVGSSPASGHRKLPPLDGVVLIVVYIEYVCSIDAYDFIFA